MFMFPEPPPLDYYITDIKPSFLSDGIFHRGNPAPTHKYIGKQLNPIKRTLNDPLAPIRQLDPRILERSLNMEKATYVAGCGEDDGMIYETHRSMPKRKHHRGMAKKPTSSIFSRSPQYELWYIRDRRAKIVPKPEVITVECSRKEEETPKMDKEQCDLLRPPFWWKDVAGESKRLPMGNINDYAFEKLKEAQLDERKISERLEMDHPKKYIPGVIHRLKNPEDTSMKDILDRADAFKVVLKSDETLPKDAPPVAKTPCHVNKRPCMLGDRDSKQDQDADKTRFDSDRRWQPLCKEIGFSGTDLERQKELRKLTKPFSHDLLTWYSKNKPTKSSVTR